MMRDSTKSLIVALILTAYVIAAGSFLLGRLSHQSEVIEMEVKKMLCAAAMRKEG